MKILYIAAFGPIISDIDKSRDLYLKTLGLPLTEEDNHYFYTDKMEGIRHFSLMPISQAASICFGSEEWPDDIPVPTSWIEFEVEDIESATEELEDNGYELFISAEKEQWGQIATWFLSPEGILTKIASPVS